MTISMTKTQNNKEFPRPRLMEKEQCNTVNAWKMTGIGRNDPEEHEVEIKSLLGGDEEDNVSEEDYECGVVGKETVRDTMNEAGSSLRLLWFLFAASACFFFSLGFLVASFMGNKEQPSLNTASVSNVSNESLSLESPLLSDSFGEESEMEDSSGEKKEEEATITANPTESPTLQPTATSTAGKADFTLKKEEMVGHVVYNDLHYRRVCAPVHSSVLCMTVRFPFEVPEQDRTKDFPFPVDDRMYTLKKNTGGFVDGEDLEACKQIYTNLSIDDTVKACLEYFANKNPEKNDQPRAVWTRRNSKGITQLYGTNSPQQQKRIDEYFENEMILMFGASPSPGVAGCMLGLFGDCHWSGIKPGGNQMCKGHPKVRMLGNTNTWPGLAMNETFIGVTSYYPRDIGHGRTHDLPGMNVTQHMRNAQMDRKDTKRLRKLTIISEYPIAHAQNQRMIYNEIETVKRIQDGFPKIMLDAGSEIGRKELAEMGYDLQRIIAYDGIPQFNPTLTGAHDLDIKLSHSEEQFLEKEGYPGWKPEYGSKCRGPLVPTSKLTEVNQLSYKSFEEKGLDMRFYGRIWEFSNIFWFDTQGWSTKGLDCTHSPHGSGMSCVHKFFLMAMVDDEYDIKQ